MTTQKIVAAVAAASLVFSGATFAQSTGAQDQAMRENGIQNPNGPRQSPQQLRDGARVEQQGVRDGRRSDPRGQYRPDQRVQSRPDQRDYRVDQRNYRGDNRGGDYRNYGYREGGYRGQGRGAGPEHGFYRGDRLPYTYRSRQYVVDDWRGHHLYAPPQGYHWVQAGGDYVLAAVATGLIAAILLSQ